VTTPALADGAPVQAPPAAALPAVAHARALRTFHLGTPSAAERQAAGPFFPALLAPYRDVARLRIDYPLFLVPGQEGRLTAVGFAQQVRALLDGRLADGARMLRDNLDRLEKIVRDALLHEGSPVDARGVLVRAGQTLLEQLGLSEASTALLAADLKALGEVVPSEAKLLGFSASAGLQLSVFATEVALTARREAYVHRVKLLVQKLDRVLRVERAKAPGARDPNALAAAMPGPFGQLDTAALSVALGPHRGSKVTSSERLDRLEQAREVLGRFVDEVGDAPFAVAVVGEDAQSQALASFGVRTVRAEDPCGQAACQFDLAAAELATVVRAVRTCELELDNRFEPALHEPMLEGLGWEGFTREELALVPPIFALDDAERLTREGLRSLSALLRSGRPVKVLVEVDPSADPDAQVELGKAVRFELGYFGISHREALVHQSTAARPGHLLAGIGRALGATRPSLHVLAARRRTDADVPAGAWLHLGAAIDGRAHPLFLYDPDGGATWARRFDLDQNTAPDQAWPVTEDALPDGQRLSFTFADFALLEPAYARHFRPVPEGTLLPLCPMASWLELSADEAARTLPFVWALGEGGKLGQLVITRQLAWACRDRQSFWRTLQEWAGVHNEHVERAVAAALADAALGHQAELEGLKATAEATVEAVRRDTAAEALQRLAATLLSTDPAALAGSVGAAAVASAAAASPAGAPGPAAAQAQAAPAAQPAAEAPADDLSFDDPFIDTVLCTSCNDCTAINSVMFVYDSNKQARIGDVTAGTFEQMVMAAEKCPAKCIHPGKPKNPNEPNLPALIERAKPFN
jgi:ferredoxin